MLSKSIVFHKWEDSYLLEIWRGHLSDGRSRYAVVVRFDGLVVTPGGGLGVAEVHAVYETYDEARAELGPMLAELQKSLNGGELVRSEDLAL